MAVWLVRAGREGEREDFAMDQDVDVIGWDELPNLMSMPTRADLEAD
jgi:restriction system protein